MSSSGFALRAASVALFATAVLLASRPAHAVYQCGDQKDDCQCGANDPYPCCDNGGNCTWWAWEAACCNWAVALPGWGNANQWVGNAQLDPNYEVLSAPVVGSVACRVSGTYGHVAWVTAVNGGGISVTEENCCGTCNYGLRSHDYQASYFDGGFIVRKGQCDCSAGQTQSEGCGNCGTRNRSCGGDCKWSGWESCGGEGACADGQTDEQTCGDCGTQTRVCSGSCQWGDFGACSGPDPGGGTEPCETALRGACATGLRKCVEGTLQCQQQAQPVEEICDGIDNDCNGAIDDTPACADAAPILADGGKPPAEDSGAGWTDGGERDGGAPSWYAGGPEENAGCACSVASGRRSGSALLLGLLAGLALLRRSRTTRP